MDIIDYLAEIPFEQLIRLLFGEHNDSVLLAEKKFDPPLIVGDGETIETTVVMHIVK